MVGENKLAYNYHPGVKANYKHNQPVTPVSPGLSPGRPTAPQWPVDVSWTVGPPAGCQAKVTAVQCLEEVRLFAGCLAKVTCVQYLEDQLFFHSSQSMLYYLRRLHH